MYDTKPELIGIYNMGVKGQGGGGGGGSVSGDTIQITIPPASLTDPGVVITRNASDSAVTSDTTNIVPTQYFLQSEVERLTQLIISGGTALPSGYATEEFVSTYVSSSLDWLISRYGLTPVPIVKYPAPVIDPSRDNSVISNTDVTLLATSWDPAITSRQYSTNGNSWQTYTDGGVLVTSNSWRYFRGMDDIGDLTETASYHVTNIDKQGPPINFTGGFDSMSYDPQVVSATTTEGGVMLYWSMNGETPWSSSTSPAVVNVTISGTLYFSASDIYGNKTVKSIVFQNIGGSSSSIDPNENGSAVNIGIPDDGDEPPPT